MGYEWPATKEKQQEGKEEKKDHVLTAGIIEGAVVRF